jgi:hypothetical protein
MVPSSSDRNYQAEVADLARADPVDRLRRWCAAPDADRYLWFASLLDRLAVREWTLEQARAALFGGERLSVTDIERIRSMSVSAAPPL